MDKKFSDKLLGLGITCHWCGGAPWSYPADGLGRCWHHKDEETPPGYVSIPDLIKQQDIEDIRNHKRFRWMFDAILGKNKKSMIHHYSKGTWGEIRWDWGFICGIIFSGPWWLILFMLLFLTK